MKKMLALALLLCSPQIGATQGRSASLDLCLSRYRAGQAHYLATIRWPSRPTAEHLILGALDTSNVVWVQKTHERMSGESVEYLRFTVSDVSAYPLQVAVYDLSEAAYQEYKDACRRNQECYFGPESAGVKLLSTHVRVESAAIMNERRPCPKD